MKNKKFHLVVIGFGSIVYKKYIECIKIAQNSGFIDSYSVIDLKSQELTIRSRLKNTKFQPENVFLLSTNNVLDQLNVSREFILIMNQLRKRRIKVYIATEVRAHEAYLRYCIKNNLDSLTEKPVIAPIVNNSFAPRLIMNRMHSLINRTKVQTAKHSVMSMDRYHDIYNGILIKKLKKNIIKWRAPITSLHLRYSGGVWNSQKEFKQREDYPYKYGYGMLMHGAYHYVDFLGQILTLNKIIFKKTNLVLTLSSQAAYPNDQIERIPKKFSNSINDYCLTNRLEGDGTYGETDIVSSFCLKIKNTGRIITLGTLALEQTTPSIRSWSNLPSTIYNKNGRVASADFEAQLSTLYSIKVNSYDYPSKGTKNLDKISATVEILERTNASLIKDMPYITRHNYHKVINSDSNRKLLSAWLEGKEKISLLSEHGITMKIIQQIALSLKKPGKTVSINI